jgi:hypothetical protein
MWWGWGMPFPNLLRDFFLRFSCHLLLPSPPLLPKYQAMRGSNYVSTCAQAHTRCLDPQTCTSASSMAAIVLISSTSSCSSRAAWRSQGRGHRGWGAAVGFANHHPGCGCDKRKL